MKYINLLNGFVYWLFIDDKLLGYKNSIKDLNEKTTQYLDISDTLDKYTSNIPGEVKDSPKRLGRTLKNMFVNAIDNSFGYLASSWQNYKTKRALKKGDDKPIVYTIHGRAQNKGSHWRMGRDLKKQGFHVYHLKGNHGTKDINKRKEKAYAQIDKLHNYANTNPSKTRAYITGHSSGADLGIAIANDDKIHDYGIKAIQARAPLPYGMKKKNIYTRALSNIIDIKDDFRTSKEGNKKAALNYFTEPKVPVYVSAGKNDRLVNPKDAFYRPATSFKVLDHKDSGHFGTSGQNKKMNNYFINEIKDIENKYNITKIHKPSNYY
jgi:dienelactone hydrolase